MPLEKPTGNKTEWRARVKSPGECIKDSYVQLWPKKGYNKKGIRAIGCKDKKSKKMGEQSIRFSDKKKYGWSATKIRAWLKSHGHSLKALYKIYLVNADEFQKVKEYDVHIRSTEEFKVKSSDDEKNVITGPVSSDQVDKHDEIVDPDAIMKSKKSYMEFPTVRYMHEADPVGLTLDLWKKGNKVLADIEIFDNKTELWHMIEKKYLRAFSIGFRVREIKNYCPDGSDGECFIRFTEIDLIEISIVDSPANTDAVFEVKKQLDEIGGKQLVNKLFTKVDEGELEDDDSDGNMYDDWSNTTGWDTTANDNSALASTGDVDTLFSGITIKNIIKLRGEKVKDDEKEEELEEFEEAPEAEAEDSNTDSEEGSEEEESGDEEEEEFIPAEEENKELTKINEDMDSMKDDISTLKDSIVRIEESITALTNGEDEKMKALETKNKELEKKVEEKKLPKRKSHKSVEDEHGEMTKEEKLKNARKEAKSWLQRKASKLI